MLLCALFYRIDIFPPPPPPTPQETRLRQLDDALTLLERDTAALNAHRVSLDERTQTLLDGEARLAADTERHNAARAAMDRERAALQLQQAEHRQTAQEAHARRVGTWVRDEGNDIATNE